MKHPVLFKILNESIFPAFCNFRTNYCLNIKHAFWRCRWVIILKKKIQKLNASFFHKQKMFLNFGNNLLSTYEKTCLHLLFKSFFTFFLGHSSKFQNNYFPINFGSNLSIQVFQNFAKCFQILTPIFVQINQQLDYFFFYFHL